MAVPDTAAFPGAARRDFETGKNLAVHCGGWQSWSAGWELAGREKLPRKVALIPELLKLTNSPGDDPQEAGELTGHFIIYLRSGDLYLCIAALGSADSVGGAAALEGAESGLPPVRFRISRKRRRISAEASCPGKIWRPGETMARLCVFAANGFFSFKDALQSIYRQEDVFGSAAFLWGGGKSRPVQGRQKDAVIGGYGSWYNHYTNISEKLILEDLDALGKTENLLKLRFIDRGKPLVFQIDDGWERAVGEWDIQEERFPNGLAPIAARIEAAGFIPGLWLAPFLVTRRSRIFRERPEWLLREKSGGPGGAPGEPVVAGFNHLWDKRYYCLDLSRQDVLEYLDGVIGRVIDQWGFRFLKLDFLYTGLFYGDFTQGGSPYEHYRRASSLLTRRSQTAAGLPVAYLGCGLPLGLSYRNFPLSRIGADTREEWDWILPKLLGHVGRPGAYVSLMDTIGRSFMDGSVYLSDPDVVFLRSRNCKLSETEKELIALVNFLLASEIMFSDDPLHLEETDIALTRRISGLYDRLSGDGYGAVRIAREVFRLESRSKKIWGLINLSSRNFTLNASRDPDLFQRFREGKFLLDHRGRNRSSGLAKKTSGQNKIAFLPHSITIIFISRF